MQLEGKKIIIVGSRRGIGYGSAKAFVREGAQVCGCGRKPIDEEKLKVANEAGPGSFTYFQCDASDRAQVDEYIDKSVALMGGVDVLVVSVMDYWLTMCEDCTYEEMMRSFNNNFFSVFNANQSVLRYMKETGGKIINFGSGAGVTTKTPGDDPSPYSVAKAAVHSWTKCVAKEWCQYGITANCVLPLALSDASLDFRMDKEAEKKLDERTKIFVNIGRFGDIDTEITPFVVFLATDGSKYMTGQLFNVDGGMVESR